MPKQELHADRLDRMKLLYDLSKHITTLATGTLLLMTGLFEKVFKTPVWKSLAQYSIVLFAASIVASVVAMLGFAMYSRSTFKTNDDPVQLGVHAFALSFVLFGFGIVLFTVFALKNL